MMPTEQHCCEDNHNMNEKKKDLKNITYFIT